MKEYIPRIVDSIFKLKLETMGAVYVKGAKWCGKTTTSEQFAKSVVYLDDPESGESLRAMAEHSPSMLLQGIVPRLIDEWQLVLYGMQSVLLLTNAEKMVNSSSRDLSRLRMMTRSITVEQDVSHASSCGL